MRIGLAYDLRSDYPWTDADPPDADAELDSKATIEGLTGTLTSLGHEVVHIGGATRIQPFFQNRQVDLVFNIAEGFRGRNRESQVPILLEMLDVPYTFSDALTLSLTLDKAMAKRVVSSVGIPTAGFFEITDPADLDQISLPFPLFLKPGWEGSAKGIGLSSRVEDPAALRGEARRLLETYHQPVLVETYLPGREFTVGIVGTGREARVAGWMEVEISDPSQGEIYGWVNKEECETRVKYLVPADLSSGQVDRIWQTALEAYRVLGCRDAGRLDLRCDRDGIPNFLEANPLPGLHPVRSDLTICCRLNGMDYSQLISLIVESALKRSDGRRQV